MTVSAENNPEQSVKSLKIPGIDRQLGDVGRARVLVEKDRATVHLELRFPASGIHEAIEALIRQELQDKHGLAEVVVEISTKITAHGVQRNLKPLADVRNIIAIASGKGGVGKSTTAVNLALALAAEGARTGILDADIYGPSVPLMLGVAGERPTSDDGQSMNPPSAHGLQVMSIGFLIDADQPMVWRGPMVTSALNQMLQQKSGQVFSYSNLWGRGCTDTNTGDYCFSGVIFQHSLRDHLPLKLDFSGWLSIYLTTCTLP